MGCGSSKAKGKGPATDSVCDPSTAANFSGDWLRPGDELVTIELDEKGRGELGKAVFTADGALGCTIDIGGEKVTGDLSQDKKVINWSDGQVWNRPKAEPSAEEKAAATKIQATVKGKQSRAETAVIAQNKKEAATKVQAIVRGNRARATTAAKANGGKEEADQGTDGDGAAKAGDAEEVPNADAAQVAQVENTDVPPFPGQARPANPDAGGGFFFCCTSAPGTAPVVETPSAP